MHLKISSAKMRPFCPGGDELTHRPLEGVVVIKSVISEHMLVMVWIKFVSTSCDIAIIWMPRNSFDDKSDA